MKGRGSPEVEYSKSECSMRGKVNLSVPYPSLTCVVEVVAALAVLLAQVT